MSEMFNVSKKDSYKLWLEYNTGKVERLLTEEEKKEMEAYDFALELLVPTNRFLEELRGYGELRQIKKNPYLIYELSERFMTEPEIILIKLDKLIIKSEKNETCKVLKKISDAQN